MSVVERIDKAIYSLKRAKMEYLENNKRLSLGSLDYAQDRVTASKWLLIAQIEEDN